MLEAWRPFRDLSDLVGELATHSEAFRTRWAAHNVRFHTGVKHFHHPEDGELSLSFNRLDLAADHGLTIFTYAAEPGSRSEEALKLLGSWAATVDRAESARSTDQNEARARLESNRQPGRMPADWASVREYPLSAPRELEHCHKVRVAEGPM